MLQDNLLQAHYTCHSQFLKSECDSIHAVETLVDQLILHTYESTQESRFN